MPEPESDRLIVVVGGAGYIGSVLTRQLLERGYRVKVVDRFFFGPDCLDAAGKNERLTTVRQDSRWLDAKELEGAEAVADLTGLANDPSCDLDPELTRDINERGSVHLADLVARVGARFVFSSSCSVYGTGQESSLTETSSLAPVSLYAKLKLAVEEDLLRRHEAGTLGSVILRNATVYGMSLPRTRFDLLVNMMTAYAYEKGKIYVLGGGQQWRPLVHVSDVARAFVSAIEAPEEKAIGEIFNVGHENFQVREVAHMVAARVPGAMVEQIPDDPDKRTYSVSYEKIRKALGFAAQVTVDDGIVEIYNALRQGRIRSDERRSRTLDYYRFLLEAQKVVQEVELQGRML